MLCGYTMETIAPAKQREEHENKVDGETLNDFIPRYHVVLLDDEYHTYEYVVEMLMRLFRHDREMCWKMASDIDQQGRSIVFTTNKEQAEHKILGMNLVIYMRILEVWPENIKYQYGQLHRQIDHL